MALNLDAFKTKNVINTGFNIPRQKTSGLNLSAFGASGQEAVKPKVAVLPGFLGGGAYNLGKPNELIKTEAKYGLIPGEIGKEGHHIIPVEFGGSSETDKNMKNLPKEVHNKITEAQREISSDYKAGRLDLPEARLKMMGLIQEVIDKEKGLDKTVLGNLKESLWETITSPIKSFKQALNFNQQTVQTLEDLKTGLTTQADEFTMKKTASDFISSIYQSEKHAVEKLDKLFNEKGTRSEKVGQALEATAGTVGVLLSPITAAFEASKNLPVIGSIASVINLPLAVAGDAMTNLSNEGLNALVATGKMKKETAENVRQGINEVANLAAQVAVAGKMFKGKEKEAKIKELEKKHSKKDAETIVEKANEMGKKEIEFRKAQEAKVAEKPKLNVSAFEKTKNIKKIKELDIKSKSEKLGDPVLQVGNNKVAIKLPKGLTTEQRAKLYDEVGSIRDFKTQPIHISQKRILDTPAGKNLEVITLSKGVKQFPEIKKLVEDIGLDTVGGRVQQPIRYEQLKETPVRPSGNATASVAKSIETKAVEKGLVEGGFDSLASFERTTLKDQAKIAKETVKNIDRARSIIRGERSLPEGLNGISLVKAMEIVVRKTKNADIAYELANSPLTQQVSLAAQELSLTRGRTLDSASAQIARVKKMREKKAKKDLDKKKEIKKDIKKETEKTNLPKEDLKWNKFLDSIKC